MHYHASGEDEDEESFGDKRLQTSCKKYRDWIKMIPENYIFVNYVCCVS